MSSLQRPAFSAPVARDDGKQHLNVARWGAPRAVAQTASCPGSKENLRAGPFFPGGERNLLTLPRDQHPYQPWRPHRL